MKATAKAPSNVAFIKYWGKTDERLRLPTNSSISVNLDNLFTTTTVEFNSIYKQDEVYIDSEKATQNELFRVSEHLDRIRKIAKSRLHAKVVSKNSFPKSTGLSSSASAFAALSVAATNALNLKLTEKDLSCLARLASGSASRSIPDGFVEWKAGESHEASYSYSLHSSSYWEIVDIVCILSMEEKMTKTTDAQKHAVTSPFFNTRLANIKSKLKVCKESIENKDFISFGEFMESEAMEMHAVIMTQKPYFFYLYPETIMIINKVKSFREEGLAVYFTVNTGHNIHLFCQEKDLKILTEKIKKIEYIEKYIICRPSNGARLINNHLF